MFQKSLETISGQTDFFICSAGFEDRAKGSVQKFKDFIIGKSFLIKYKQTVSVPTSDGNAQFLENKLKQCGKYEDILVDPLNPIFTINQLMKKICQNTVESPSITIDVSVMSRLMLFLLLRNLNEHKLIHNCRFLYTEPSDYPVAKKRLSIGNSPIEVIPTFEGYINHKSETLMLIELGYEGDRALTVWEKYDPKSCILTLPDPPYRDEWYSRMHNQAREIIAAVGEEHIHPLNSNNPKLIEKGLERIFAELDPMKEKNWYIATMGTKPQAIGTFYFFLKTDFRPTLIYSTPKQHTEYSEGISDTYYLEIPDLQ